MLNKFKDIFKEQLSKEDVIRCKEFNIDVNRDSDFKPRNYMMPVDIAAHLHKAADKELKKAIKAGVLEPCNKVSEWPTPGLFVEKQRKEGEAINERIVADFREVNRILKRTGYPMEGSSQLLKRLEPQDRYFQQ